MHPWIAPLLHLLWPCSCPVCGRVGEVACPPCLESLVLPLAPHCLLCQGPFPCPRHPRAPGVFPGALHEGKARELVHLLKYEGWKALGVPMGRALASKLPRLETDLLVPVPLHRGSPRAYNQAAGLARGLASLWGTEVAESLRWTLQRPPQVASDGVARRLPEGALAWARPGPAGRVVLVDDVSTTGETLRAAARAAGAAGWKVAGAVVWTWSPGGCKEG